jgi:hypothetical protein
MPREIKSAADVKGLVTPPPNENDFKDRLVKLIPSEIVTAYVTIQGLITVAATENSKADLLLWIVIGVLFALTPLYLSKVGNVKKVGQIVFTAIAFLIWVLAIGSPVPEILGFKSTSIGSILLILYTLMIPFFYKG